MYTFTFEYEDGKTFEVKHVTRVQYLFNGLKTISENEILTHHFPLGINNTAYSLYSEKGNYIFNSNNLRHISIEQEN